MSPIGSTACPNCGDPVEVPTGPVTELTCPTCETQLTVKDDGTLAVASTTDEQQPD